MYLKSQTKLERNGLYGANSAQICTGHLHKLETYKAQDHYPEERRKLMTL